MSQTDSEILRPFAEVIGGREGTSRYVLGDSIGSGAFGRVWHVMRREDKKHFVAKLVELHRMEPTAALRARSEVGCLAACSHFACVGFIEDFNADNNLLIIMEYCDAGDLHFQLSSRLRSGQSGYSERRVRLILIQIVLALNHMHRRKMLHRDIKAANVLLSTAGLVKIGDFGLSREYSHHTIDANVAQTFCGTADYLAPEVWSGRRYGARADVWSLGILAFECLVGTRPFTGANMRDQILNNDVVYPATLNLTPEFRQMMDGMLRRDPATRMSIREVLASDCMQQALTLFEDSLANNTRLTEEARAFVREGIAEARTPVPPRAPVPLPSFEGPVGKLKEGRFVDRYLVLKDGFLGIFKDHAASQRAALSATNAKPVAAVMRATCVPISGGSNGVENVFALEFYGSTPGQGLCLWLRSDDCVGWVNAIREAQIF